MKVRDPDPHEVQRVGFTIIRDGVCPLCAREVVSVVAEERSVRLAAYHHAQLCIVEKILESVRGSE